MTEYSPLAGQRRAMMLALLVASSIGFSLFFACATPFAALATVAALKMNRHDGIAAIGLVWIVNQLIGYGVLGYPWTWDSAAWGISIGLSGLFGLRAAAALAPRESAAMAISLPFLGAFASYELSLYVASFILPGGSAGFTAVVVEQIFVVNLGALIALLGIHHLGSFVGLTGQRSEGSLLAVISR